MKHTNWYWMVGRVLTAALVLFALVGWVWTPYDPTAMSSPDKYAPPSLAHPFGCDQMGRDILSRTLEGAGSTLTIALSILAIGFVAGLIIGALCGYFGGVVDALVMRLCDTLSAFPSILLGIVVVSLLGTGTYKVIGVLGVLFIPSFARLVRGEFLKHRDRDYVRAARLMGVSHWRILFAHILPNTWPVLLSGLTIGFNNAVLSEASMTYLGIGVVAPDVSLGRLLNEAQSYWFTCPWYMLFPALVIVLLILGVGLLGEGLRERMG